MRTYILLGALLLAGCAASEAKEAERQYNIVSNGTDDIAKCAAAKAVESAWLKAEDVDKYEHWAAVARTQCYLARVRGSTGGLVNDPALDNLDSGIDAAK